MMSSRHMKTIIERGASWTLEETKLLLALWGQDLIQRQSNNNHKRTKEDYEKISEKLTQNGFDRTPDQVRTRIFNMIAEYRRILKDPNPERMKKCIFYEPLDRIYHAKHKDEIKEILDDLESDYLNSPSSNAVYSERGDESISDSEAALDGNDTVKSNNNTTITTIAAAAAATTAATATTATTTTTTATTTSTNNSTSGSNINVNTTNTNSNNFNSSSAQANSNSNSSSNIKSTDNNGNNDTNNTVSKNNTSMITEKDVKEESSSSLASNEQQATTGTTPAKRMRVDSPKSSQSNQVSNQTSTTNTGNNSKSSQGNANTTPSTSSKHNRPQQQQQSIPQPSTSVPFYATTIGGTPISSTSTIRTQQSLLMPQTSASTVLSSTSTPITKFTTNTTTTNNTPSYLIHQNHPTKLPIIRTNLINGPNGSEPIHLNGATTRLPTTAAIGPQLYQAPINTFDVTSSALLIDRMFAHLSRESENMREWIALEKERLAVEKTRRQQEAEREFRRERVLMDTLMRFQDQWISFISRLEPRASDQLSEVPPELRYPLPQDIQQNTATYSTLPNNNKDKDNTSSQPTSKQPETDK